MPGGQVEGKREGLHVLYLFQNAPLESMPESRHRVVLRFEPDTFKNYPDRNIEINGRRLL
jgi:hypothetical protein